MADIIYLPGKASMDALHRHLSQIFTEIEVAKGYVAANYGHKDVNVQTRSQLALESMRKACSQAQALLGEIRAVK